MALRVRQLQPWLLLGVALLTAFAAGRMIQIMTCAFGPAAAVAQETGPQARGQALRVSDDARAAGTEPEGFSNGAAPDPRRALAGSSVETPTAAPTVEGVPSQAARQWQPPEQYDQKYVPIISLLQGTRVGVARVNGPHSRVTLTQAVAQFSIVFGDYIHIDIYVPVSTREAGLSISRVQGVGVTGQGDLRL